MSSSSPLAPLSSPRARGRALMLHCHTPQVGSNVVRPDSRTEQRRGRRGLLEAADSGASFGSYPRPRARVAGPLVAAGPVAAIAVAREHWARRRVGRAARRTSGWIRRTRSRTSRRSSPRWNQRGPASPTDVTDSRVGTNRMADLRQEHQRLVREGAWRSGPADFLAVLNRSGHETYHSLLIAWLCRPEGHHGLGDRFLRRLLAGCGPAPNLLDDGSDSAVHVTTGVPGRRRSHRHHDRDRTGAVGDREQDVGRRGTGSDGHYFAVSMTVSTVFVVPHAEGEASGPAGRHGRHVGRK